MTALMFAAGLFLAAASALPQTDAAMVPFEAERGMPIVEVTINGQGPFRVGVDTGAPGRTLLDPTVIAALDLAVVGSEIMSDPSGANATTVPVVGVGSLAIGGLTLTDVEAVSFDFKGQFPGAPDGILGMEAFQDHLLILDYGGARLGLAAGDLPPADGITVFDYTLDDGFITLELTVGGVATPSHLDTGQGFAALIVPEALARQVGRGEPEQAGTARTASGVLQTYETDIEGAVMLGQLALPVTRVRYPSVIPVANLGSRAFAGGRLTVDQRNRRIRIELPAAAD